MALTDADYLQQLQELLPPGPAWPRDPDAYLTRLLSAWAAECARVDARANALMDEADPRATAELLPDWERMLGLPDPLLDAHDTREYRMPWAATGYIAPDLTARRARVVARLTAQPQATAAAIAADLTACGWRAPDGGQIAIDLVEPWSVDDDWERPAYDDTWRYAWIIRVWGLGARANEPATQPLADIHHADVDHCWNGPLATWGDPVLHAYIARIKPAHTCAIVCYPL